MEPAAAYHAARRAEEEELRDLAGLFRALEEQADRGEPIVQQAKAIHAGVAAAAHNPLLKELLTLLGERIFREGGTLPEMTAREYRELGHYLQSRNGEGARAVTYMALLRICQDVGLEIE